MSAVFQPRCLTQSQLQEHAHIAFIVAIPLHGRARNFPTPGLGASNDFGKQTLHGVKYLSAVPITEAGVSAFVTGARDAMHGVLLTEPRVRAELNLRLRFPQVPAYRSQPTP